MQTADRTQSACRQHGHMLQIPLAPTSVANRKIGQRWRYLLVTARHPRNHVHSPAASAHQRSLDEIVTHDGSAEWLAAREFRQSGALGERARADHRVVAPVVAFRAMPPGNAVCDERPIDATGKLLC